MATLSSSNNWQPVADGQSDDSACFHVRAAQPGDLASLAEILADSFYCQDGILGWAYPLLRLGIYEDLRSRLRSASQYHICLVAIDTTVGAAAQSSSGRAKDVAGTVEMAMRSSDPWVNKRSRYLYVSNLAVCPAHRRRGAAGQLLLNCERVALSWGFHDLFLHVLENNHQARQLYFKLGYQLHHVDTNWGTWLLGRPRQLFLHKHLGGAEEQERKL